MLSYVDHRADPAAWARRLDISREAVDLYLAAEVIDLHTCSFMWSRILPGYDLRKRHRPWLPGSFALNQVDLPRAREAQMAGICWDVPTNPYRRSGRRADVTFKNLERIAAVLGEFPDEFRVVRNHREYLAARAAGLTASLLALQGGNALDHDLDALDRIPDDLVHRITVVHLTPSKLGTPNSRPRRGGEGLSDFGRDYVRKMQDNRILVDLSHINRQGFFDALAATDPAIPVVVTHTGVAALRPMWRNIDDEQIRAIAARAGTIGIIYHPMFLADAYLDCSLERVIDHMAHVIDLVGDDHVSLGSDYDGLIALPRELPDITYQPRMVALMLARGWSVERIKKILGGNFLRVLAAVRP